MRRAGVLVLLWRRRAARVGMVGTLGLVLLAVFADVLASEATTSPLPGTETVFARLGSPSLAHWLGTDGGGHDVLACLVHGTRASLLVGSVAVVVMILLGVSLGAIGGFFGGRIDAAVTRAVEVLLSFPTILVVLAMRGITGGAALLDIAIVIGLLRWTDVARLTRAEVLRARASDFVVAAHALGVPPMRVLSRHVMPHAIGPAIVAAPFGVAAAVLVEASLAFLGIGGGTASWGQLLAQARQHPDAWWLAVFPGLALFVAVLSFHLLGESLRDAIDPHLRGTELVGLVGDAAPPASPAPASASEPGA